jgi:23S rRNA pseudouridine1911/1915/1917 synthase
VARSDEAYGKLQNAIRRRDVERRYLGLVRGHPRSRTGRIEAPIGRDRNDPTRRSLDTDEPREAVTHFELLETLAEHALLEVKLETGRTHQIRVHLAAIGHPIVGDDRYGDVRAGLDAPRPMLHAQHLAFTHPRTQRRVEFDAPLPADMADVVSRLR